ncbi:phage tail protein [Humibacter albus]|uniref:phage tail protein n=1 Tax=Humibacter albus TaxID=427754 RepID=UPI0003B6007B|nr:tail fiber protein [Humibacter albus]
MSEPYVGEIRMFAGNFAPNGWAFCDGSLVAISEYDTLFALIGTTYGGDGQSTFALPDLRGRAPVHIGNGAGQTVALGELGGVESVTLSGTQLPTHGHAPQGSTQPANRTSPVGNVWASWSDNPYSTAAPSASMAEGLIGSAGSGLPHDNMPPFQVINFIISFFGIFPNQS